jgi:hypothetical protein
VEKLGRLFVEINISDSLAAVLSCFATTAAKLNCNPRDRGTLEGVLIEGHSDHSRWRENGKTLSLEESDDRNNKLSGERALTVLKEIK